MVPVVLAAAGVVVVSGGRVWFTGRVVDEGLGSADLQATGAQAVPGLVALGLVVGAGVLAAATSGAVLRRVTLIVTALAATALAVLALRAAAGAEDVLGGLAATASGRTGTVPVGDVAVSAWPWVVTTVAALALLSAVAGLAGARGWRGLGQRYDSPAAGDATGARGQRMSSAWDDLDRGIDPSDADGQRPPPT